MFLILLGVYSGFHLLGPVSGYVALGKKFCRVRLSDQLFLLQTLLIYASRAHGLQQEWVAWGLPVGKYAPSNNRLELISIQTVTFNIILGAQFCCHVIVW